ncbi:MAG TPA: archease [Thermodesulfobacteriota bacterium]|nr:archease [Deltaproteobacteria bacterium]HOC39501.1 archease [Thermodesulfobacteriota bacterium]
MRKYRFLDHTGDEGVIAYGTTPVDLFQHAAEGFYAVLTDSKKVRPVVMEQMQFEADGYDNLLVTWLKELLFLFETKLFLGRRIDVENLDCEYLKVSVWGETYDEGRHSLRRIIKAVTYHQLTVEMSRGRWRAQFVLDL